MPIKEIRRYAKLREGRNATLEVRMEMLGQHRKVFDEQAEQLQDHMAKRDDKIDFYHRKIEHTTKNKPEFQKK